MGAAASTEAGALEHHGRPPHDEEVKDDAAAAVVVGVGGDGGVKGPSEGTAATPIVDEEAATVAVAAPTPPVPVPDFYNSGCAKSLGVLMLGYIVALAAATVFAVTVQAEAGNDFVVFDAGLVILSLLPAVTFMAYMQKLFPKSVLRSEMVLTFFWAIIVMSPLAVLENLWNWLTTIRSGLMAEASVDRTNNAVEWGWFLLLEFVGAFCVAAAFEEVTKYLAMARLKRLSYVQDPPAMVTYTLTVGAAFGCVETLLFYARYGVGVAMLRATLPLHIVLGALTGCALARDKFVHPVGSRPWYKAIALPFLIHGLFDLVIPIASVANVPALVYILSILIVVGATVLARWYYLQVLADLPAGQASVDIHAQIKDGTLTPPSKRRVAVVALAAVAVCIAFLIFVLPTLLYAVQDAAGEKVGGAGDGASGA